MKKEEKIKSKLTQKPNKLKLHKGTLKDLHPEDSSQVKGGAIKTGQYTCYIRHC